MSFFCPRSCGTTEDGQFPPISSKRAAWNVFFFLPPRQQVIFFSALPDRTVMSAVWPWMKE